jgi:hypothetical protein
MIAYLKSILQLPAIGWIVDTGNYIGIGNSIANKNLTITNLDRKFIPNSSTTAQPINSHNTVSPIGFVIDSNVSGGGNLLCC